MGPRGSQQHTEVALRAFRFGLFWLDPPAVGERASQKSSLGLLWLGAGQEVGGGWSPVAVTAQMDARSGGAALRERPRRSGEQVMVNHVVLVGNLGSDPEVRTFGDQQKVTRLSVATHEIVRKRSGERERQTEWHQVVAWAALGERAAKHLRKGRNVLVEGRIQTRVWADARGNKHITAEIRADRILFLGRGGASGDTIARDEDNHGRERQFGAEARS
jgi:single-strand DNA-binding protein